MKSVYIICAKCGSDDVKFKIHEPNDHNIRAGVYLFCTECGELTSVEEINEQLEHKRKQQLWLP